MSGEIPLTGIDDVNILILLSLSDNDLGNLVETNSYFRYLIHRGKFLTARVARVFGEDVLLAKPRRGNHLSQYFYLKRAPFRLHSGNGRIDGWKYTRKLGIHPTRLDYRIAAREGRLNLLKYFSEDSEYRHSVEGAIVGGYVHIIQWMEENSQHIDRDEIPFSSEIIDRTILSKNYDIVIWLIQHNHYPTREGSDNSIKTGLYSLTKILSEKGVLPTVVGANRWAAEGNLPDLKWLHSRGVLPDVNGADSAAANGHIEVLNWLYQYDTLPSRYSADIAICTDNRMMNDWLMERGVFPRPDVFRWAASNGFLEILNRLVEETNLRPSRRAADEAAFEGRYDTILWLSRFGIFPTNQGVNRVINNQHHHILDLLLTNGIVPNRAGCSMLAYLGDLKRLRRIETEYTSHCANMAMLNGQLDVLKWLCTLGVHPVSKSTLYRSVENGNLNTFRWAAKRFDHLLYRRFAIANANVAAEKGHLNVLKWFIDGGPKEFPRLFPKGLLLPNKNGVANALLFEHLDVAKWLFEREIYPEDSASQYICSVGCVETLDLLLQHDLIPTVFSMDTILLKDRLDSFVWFLESGVVFQKNFVNRAAIAGSMNILKWCASRGLYPDRRVHTRVAQLGRVEVLEWLQSERQLDSFRIHMDLESRLSVYSTSHTMRTLRWFGEQIPIRNEKSKYYKEYYLKRIENRRFRLYALHNLCSV